ncbi:MAG: ABC transporter permease [Candidatus Hydrogenedentes bacterium]|nr:ABC transporter permease [Candidatus Hydrogenedentota bacterium]
MPLQLAQRELNRSGKLKRNYALRSALAVAALMIVFLPWMSQLAMAVNGGGDALALSGTVAWLFNWMSLAFQLVVATAGAIFYGAAMIAQEKQDRTLPLLLIADFRAVDIFFAKFLATFLQCAMLILSVLPLLAISSILGGISVPVTAVRVLLLLDLAAMVCAVTLLCSTLARRPSEALIFSLILVTVLLAGAAWLAALTPRTPWLNWDIIFSVINRDDTNLAPGHWLVAFSYSLVLAMAAAALTVRLLPRQIETRVKTFRPRRRAMRLLLLPLYRRNAVAALVSGALEGTQGNMWWVLLRYVVCGLLLAATVLNFAALFISVALIVLIMSYDIGTMLASARREGRLNDLLLTPIENHQFSRALFFTAAARAIVFLPLLLALMGITLVFFSSAGMLEERYFLSHDLAFYVMMGLMIATGCVLTAMQFCCIVSLTLFVSTLATRPLVQAWIALLFFFLLHLAAASAYVAVLAVTGTLVFGLLEMPNPFIGVLFMVAVTLGVGVLFYGGAGFLFYRAHRQDFAITVRGGYEQFITGDL